MITIYGESHCVWCPKVKQLAEKMGTKYQYVDMTGNYELRQSVAKKTGFSTIPITTDGETYLAGFNLMQLMDLFRGDHEL